MEYANRALTFEKEVEKIKDLSEAAKIKSEAGIFKLKVHYEDKLKTLESTARQKGEGYTKMKWCNVMRVNAYQRRIQEMEKKHEEELAAMKRAGELAVSKVQTDIGAAAKEERASHMRAQHDHELQLMQLHKEITTKDQEHARLLDVIRKEVRVNGCARFLYIFSSSSSSQTNALRYARRLSTRRNFRGRSTGYIIRSANAMLTPSTSWRRNKRRSSGGSRKSWKPNGKRSWRNCKRRATRLRSTTGESSRNCRRSLKPRWRV